jgi:hypothetical protein
MRAKLLSHLLFAAAVLCVPVLAQPAPSSTNNAGGPPGGGFRRMMEDSTNIVKLGTIRLRGVRADRSPVCFNKSSLTDSGSPTLELPQSLCL